MLGHVGEQAHGVLIEEPADSLVNWLKFKVDERIFKTGHAAAIQLIAEAIPGLFCGRPLLVPVHEDVALIRVQMKCEAPFGHFASAAQIFESGERVAPGKDRA